MRLAFWRRDKPRAVSIREAETPHSADIPENDHYWRSLSQAKRDMAEWNQSRMLELACWLRLHNGFAKRFEEIITDFTAGEEPKPVSENEKLQEVLDEFWYDPTNGMCSFAREIAAQISSLGEQYITANVRGTDGLLRLGYVDPSFVKAVKCDPQNPRDLVEVVVKVEGSIEEKRYRIIRAGEEVSAVYANPKSGKVEGGAYAGAIFAWSINRLSNGTRGVSDFFACADYLEALDRTTYNSAERSELLNRMAYDQKVTGTSDAGKLRAMQNDLLAAVRKPGGVYTHNEQIEVAAFVPDLKSADFAQLVRVVKQMVLATWGFPEHWFAEGGETNLATAGEMAGPTIRKLLSRQTVLRQILRHLCDFQIDLIQAITPQRLAGIDEQELYGYEIILPEITSKDTARETANLVALTQTLAAASDSGWVTGKSAAMLWQQQVAAMTGFEFRDEDRDALDELDVEEQEPEPRPGMTVLPGDEEEPEAVEATPKPEEDEERVA